MDEENPPQPVPLEIFEIQGGLIESDLAQASVDAFAADFQGLLHFGERIGGALNLGKCWMGALQESGYCLAYANPARDEAGAPRGKGARVGRQALLSEMLNIITPEKA